MELEITEGYQLPTEVFSRALTLTKTEMEQLLSQDASQLLARESKSLKGCHTTNHQPHIQTKPFPAYILFEACVPHPSCMECREMVAFES